MAQPGPMVKIPRPQQAERADDQFLFDDSIKLACDWFEASGSDSLSYEQYCRIYNKDLVSCSPDEIARIFYHWSDYLDVSLTYYHDRLNAEEARKIELLEQAESDRLAGSLPEAFFYETESYLVPYDGNDDQEKEVTRRRPTAEKASEAELLSRYSRYLVAGHFLVDPEEITSRSVNIALGYNYENGIPATGFIGNLGKAGVTVEHSDIDNVASALGVYHFIYPDVRREHHQSLLNAVEQADPEYFYDMNKKKLVMLGRTALSEFTAREGQMYLDFLRKNQLIVMGGPATQLVEAAKGSKTIVPLEKLLDPTGPELAGTGKNRNKYRDWSKTLYLSYGNWLLGLIPGLDAEIIQRAHRLGLGPSDDSISSPKRFGSTTGFFSELGFTNRITKNSLDNLTFEELVDYVAHVASLNDGKVNIDILRKHYQSREIKDVPSVWVISKLAGEGGISKVIEAAGMRVHNKKIGPEGCMTAVLAFIERENRWPTAKDFDKCPDLPSRPTLYRYYDGVLGFKKELAKLLEGQEQRLAA